MNNIKFEDFHSLDEMNSYINLWSAFAINIETLPNGDFRLWYK